MAETTKAAEEASASCCASFDKSDPIQQEVTHIMKALKRDLMGIIHLASDGVIRSLTANRTVLSAQGLNPQQITAFLSRLPEQFRKEFQIPDGADGTKVDRQMWFQPEEGTLPPPLPQEKIEAARNRPDEQKDIIRAKMKADPNLVDVSGVYD